MSDNPQYRSIFSEIIQSYSLVNKSNFGPVYIKHLNNLDLSLIEGLHFQYFEEAKNSGVFTYQERLDKLVEDGLWDYKDEEKIKDNKKLLDQYQENKSNECLKSKRDIWVGEIDKLIKSINELEFKKSSLIGITAESLAYKKSNFLHIKNSFYKNKELTINLFDEEEFNDLEEKIVNELFVIFNNYLEKFGGDVIKKISLSSFFTNMFYLTENIHEFYGKPIIDLTFYQIDLAMWGRYFRNVLGEMKNKIPQSIMNDPEKIIEYVELNKNYEKMYPKKNNDEGGAMTIPGAKRADLEILGLKAEGNKGFNELLKKKGGKANFNDLMEMM